MSVEKNLVASGNLINLQNYKFRRAMGMVRGTRTKAKGVCFKNGSWGLEPGRRRDTNIGINLFSSTVKPRVHKIIQL